MIERELHCAGLMFYEGYSLQTLHEPTKRSKGMFQAWHKNHNVSWTCDNPLVALEECERQIKAKK